MELSKRMSDNFHSGVWSVGRRLRVYTGGTFDLFHYGHVNLLKECHRIANGGRVTVSVNTDEFSNLYKQPTVMSLNERVAVLRSCRFVDDVVVNVGGADSKVAILSVMPDVIVVGDDWRNKDYCKQMGFSEEWLSEHKIQIVFVPYTKTISTTEIRGRLQ